MRIAVDVDGVLADRIGGIVELIEEQYGVTLSPTDVDEWDFSIPGTETDIHAVIEESTADRAHLLGLDPIPGAIEGMRTIASEHEILIATHRPPRIHDHTKRWLDEHEIPFDRFASSCGDYKCEVRADALIDDRPANVRAFADAHGRAILFEQPWNVDRVWNNRVTVATNWSAVVRTVSERIDEPVDETPPPTRTQAKTETRTERGTDPRSRQTTDSSER